MLGYKDPSIFYGFTMKYDKKPKKQNNMSILTILFCLFLLTIFLFVFIILLKRLYDLLFRYV